MSRKDWQTNSEGVLSMLGKGCANSGPGSLGVPEITQTDGPGFSLCAAPLELSGPGF